jgi:transcriptional regulator with XRE-family HTH domain
MKDLHLDAKIAFATNIKRIREEKNITQSELAERSGLKQATLSRIETSVVWPDYNTIVSICDALKCEHTELTSHPDLLTAFKTFNKNKLK